MVPSQIDSEGESGSRKVPRMKNSISKSRIQEHIDPDHNFTYNEPLNLNSAMGLTQEIVEKEH